ncbi:4615_t:CDS:2 [Paraglomus occultum]|uniref:4615_t:CDS:1 n=1 Tax=Paraglomus occultum TaxID=144539 RepID=A0A9N9GL71_9GLOM|nr:4615_t:CDS:2 [Paraglomus occultum]
MAEVKSMSSNEHTNGGLADEHPNEHSQPAPIEDVKIIMDEKIQTRAKGNWKNDTDEGRQIAASFLLKQVSPLLTPGVRFRPRCNYGALVYRVAITLEQVSPLLTPEKNGREATEFWNLFEKKRELEKQQYALSTLKVMGTAAVHQEAQLIGRLSNGQDDKCGEDKDNGKNIANMKRQGDVHLDQTKSKSRKIDAHEPADGQVDKHQDDDIVESVVYFKQYLTSS